MHRLIIVIIISCSFGARAQQGVFTGSAYYGSYSAAPMLKFENYASQATLELVNSGAGTALTCNSTQWDAINAAGSHRGLVASASGSDGIGIEATAAYQAASFSRIQTTGSTVAAVAINSTCSGSAECRGLKISSNSASGVGLEIGVAGRSGTFSGSLGLYSNATSASSFGLEGSNSAYTSGSGAGIRAYGAYNPGLLASSQYSNAISASSAAEAPTILSTASYDCAVLGNSAASDRPAIMGVSDFSGVEGRGSWVGVWGNTWGAAASVYGENTRLSGSSYGVAGRVASTSSGIGVFGEKLGSSGYAGYFSGNVHVNGTLSKSAGSFKIDHPADPANKFLQHSFVEAPEMLNVYSGNAILKTNGEVWIDMPDYWQVANTDPRYSITPIGSPAILYIKTEITPGNPRFLVAGGQPGQKFSWQVSSLRADPYAKQHPLVPELLKQAHERGKYLNPEVYGQPETSRLVSGPPNSAAELKP